MSTDEKNIPEKAEPELAPVSLVIPQSAVGKPTDLIRTALFAVAKKVPLPARGTPEWEKANLACKTLYARDGSLIQYSGQRLDTYDEDLFVCLVKMYSDAGVVVGLDYQTTIYKIIENMGLSRSPNAYESVRLRLDRLASAKVFLRVQMPGKNKKLRTIQGAFGLMSYALDKETGRFAYALDRFAMDFLDRMTNLEHSVWKALPSGLSRQLFGFVRSNESGVVCSYSLKKLADLFGWNDRPDRFRNRLEKAFERLVKQGVVREYGVKKGVDGGEIAMWEAIKYKELESE